MFRLGLPALALVAALYASSAGAQSTFEAPAGSGRRYPEFMLVDPITGQPYAATGGGGGGAASVPAGTSTGGFVGQTIGTSPTTANAFLPAATTTRRSLSITNEATGASATQVTVCSSTVTATPSLNLAGCHTFGPGGSYSAPASGIVPQEAFSAVASAPNTPVTIETH